MTTLVKAQLCEIAGDPGSAPVGEPIDVQFNPTTLRVAISNKTTGGNQAGSQAKQKPGTGEVSVTFDLYFDTSDEGTTDAPVPVTRRTQIVEKFVRPRGNTPAQQSPPRVQFKWGTFLVQGVMESANIDLDLFAADGTPLRAKVAVSIKGQDPSYRYDPLPPAAPASSAGTSGLPAGAPGTVGNASAPASVAEALPGESLPQLAARVGLDPSAWRALATGIGDPGSLSAGQEVTLPATLPQSGVGATNAPSQPSLVAPATLPIPQTALGAPATPPVPSGVASSVLAGQALTRQGGVRGTIDSTRQRAGQTAAAATVAAFGLASGDTASGATGRAYGGGIPMRPVIASAGAVPATPDPTIPGWQALQQRATPIARSLGRTRPGVSGGCGCQPGRRV